MDRGISVHHHRQPVDVELGLLSVPDLEVRAEEGVEPVLAECQRVVEEEATGRDPRSTGGCEGDRGTVLATRACGRTTKGSRRWEVRLRTGDAGVGSRVLWSTSCELRRERCGISGCVE